MRYVRLRSIDQETSQLGFGCVGLTALPSHADARRVLQAAFDAGIRHFDVAPAYGMGVAERLLGDFLRGRRNQITVATKFGIVPPAYTRRVPFLPTIKRILKKIPAIDARVRRRVGAANSMGHFSPEAAGRSIENSLRALHTEVIDILLLHEANLEDAQRADLLGFLEAQRSAGRIRAFGIGGEFARLGGGGALLPAAHRVLQFENNVLEANLPRLSPGIECDLVTHSVFRPARWLLENFGSAPELAHRFREETGLDMNDRRDLHRLMLAWSLQNNAAGIVLFASSSPGNIAANAALAGDQELGAEGVAAFEVLVQTLAARAGGDMAPDRSMC